MNTYHRSISQPINAAEEYRDEDPTWPGGMHQQCATLEPAGPPELGPKGAALPGDFPERKPLDLGPALTWTETELEKFAGHFWPVALEPSPATIDWLLLHWNELKCLFGQAYDFIDLMRTIPVPICWCPDDYPTGVQGECSDLQTFCASKAYPMKIACDLHISGFPWLTPEIKQKVCAWAVRQYIDECIQNGCTGEYTDGFVEGKGNNINLDPMLLCLGVKQCESDAFCETWSKNFPKCEPDSKTCVECLTSLDCPMKYPFCDDYGHYCGDCLDDSMCPPGLHCAGGAGPGYAGICQVP